MAKCEKSTDGIYTIKYALEENEKGILQLHNAIIKGVERQMNEVETPALKAKYISTPLAIIGILIGSFLMFLACV